MRVVARVPATLFASAVLASGLVSACSSAPPPPAPDPTPAAAAATPLRPLEPLPSTAAPTPYAAPPLACEPHLKDLVQLTFGGENAEAYWSFDGKELAMQTRYGSMQCDRIVRLDVERGLPSMTPVSSGDGATTCSYFMPGDREMIYASTHAGSPQCPPKPDMSLGYVWALYDTYDIWKSDKDGSNVRRLTDTPGYDAEATVCAQDGSILFTSVRDGDIELYRMDADGQNVRRLTHTPGYDGGAFFSADCSQIVWRASRPKPGAELDEFKSLLAKGLVRPSKLELYVANADGTDPVQLTYLNAASFGPYFFPSGKRVIFSSNYGDPKGREFDLWAVNTDGTDLERLTCAPGFDGFPMFSPDGTQLVFASNRATAPGQRDTNVFLAKWADGAPRAPAAATAPAAGATAPAAAAPTSAERIRDDIRWLADPARQGRGLGTAGLVASGEYIEARMKALGLAPAGDRGFRQSFEVTTRLTVLPATQLTVDGQKIAADAIAPLGFSAQATVDAPLVAAGYGIVHEGTDDYRGLDVKGRIVVVRRFVPDGEAFASTDAKRRFGDIRYKAWIAKERGAKGLLVVDAPVVTSTSAQTPEAKLPSTDPEGPGDAGIVVAAVKREAIAAALTALADKKPARARLTVALRAEKTKAFNVAGRIPATGKALGGPVVIGAHYDHLGMGDRHSLAPDRAEAHVGADDNASGTAVILEAARLLMADRTKLQRDVIVVAFSGEEAGVLGSSHFVRKPPRGFEPQDAVAMLNFDMVGRLRGNTVNVLGGESAKEWAELVGAACATSRLECPTTGDGYGPSDHTPFYAADIPVLHFFTGAHNQYHKPSDTADRVNAAGAGQIAQVASDVVKALAVRSGKLTYNTMPSPAPRGDLRSFNASLGTVPNYVGPPNGQKGMLLDGVRPGGAADQAGLRRGDIITKLGKHDVTGVEDLMFVLNASKPGETVRVGFVRDGKAQEAEVTFQESKRPSGR